MCTWPWTVPVCLYDSVFSVIGNCNDCRKSVRRGSGLEAWTLLKCSRHFRRSVCEHCRYCHKLCRCDSCKTIHWHRSTETARLDTERWIHGGGNCGTGHSEVNSRGWKLWDWTLRGEFTGVEIVGLGIERWIHGGGNCGTGHWEVDSQGWTLWDWTLRDEFTVVDIVGLDTERWIHRGGHCRIGHWEMNSQGWTLLEFGRCTHRTSKIGDIGACWNIGESASASRRCRCCKK